jgi:hypothetical protein
MLTLRIKQLLVAALLLISLASPAYSQTAAAYIATLSAKEFAQEFEVGSDFDLRLGLAKYTNRNKSPQQIEDLVIGAMLTLQYQASFCDRLTESQRNLAIAIVRAFRDETVRLDGKASFMFRNDGCYNVEKYILSNSNF